MTSILSQLIRVTCCNCATEFAMSEQLHNKRNNDGEAFYCPNGHRQYFSESEVIKLQKQLQSALSSKKFFEERSEHYRETLIHEERRSKGLKSALTLTKRRIAKGKCPCCDKTFPDLSSHIAEKHRNYKEKMLKDR